MTWRGTLCVFFWWYLVIEYACTLYFMFRSHICVTMICLFFCMFLENGISIIHISFKIPCWGELMVSLWWYLDIDHACIFYFRFRSHICVKMTCQFFLSFWKITWKSFLIFQVHCILYNVRVRVRVSIGLLRHLYTLNCLYGRLPELRWRSSG